MRYLLWIFFLILLAIRVVFFYQNLSKYPDGTKIRITDRVSSEPIRYSTSQYLKLSGFKIYLPLYPEVSYGDRVIIEGEVDGSKLKNVKLIEIHEGKGFLFEFRKELIEFYQRSLPQPHSTLMAGVTIGSKANIGKDFWESLKKSGTAHVVVASGMNVTLVSRFLISFLILFFSRRKAILLGFLGVFFYVVLSGFDAPIIRAAIMGSLTFTAQELGRLNYAWRTLVISGGTMLLVWPQWITDLGFILSFVATASLMFFQPKIDCFLKFLPKGAREDLSTSLAAQIGVTPILFVTFGQFNILSPLINAVVLWTIVPMTIIGMTAGIIGLIYEPVGTLILWLTYPLTSWFVWIVELFG